MVRNINEVVICPRCWGVGIFRDGTYEWEWQCGECDFLWNWETKDNGFMYWSRSLSARAEVGKGLLPVFKEVAV